VTRSEAIEWVRRTHDEDEIDSDTLDAVCRALGYDPEYLCGDEEDPMDRRWDTVCAEVSA
jgi:hypothetical protein